MRKLTATTLSALLVLAGGIAVASEVADAMRALAAEKIAPWANDPAIVEAVKAQNAETVRLTQDDIDRLDKTWRAQVGAAEKPLIDSVLSSDVSAFLRKIKADSGGVFTEIFVMDAKGLNVGQSDVTSDYWQGDEAKWKKTYLAGPASLHVSDVELDESTQTFQSQVSLPVVDPATGTVIGAVTVGVDVDAAMQ